jgi:hypothetical protein
MLIAALLATLRRFRTSHTGTFDGEIVNTRVFHTRK